MAVWILVAVFGSMWWFAFFMITRVRRGELDQPPTVGSVLKWRLMLAVGGMAIGIGLIGLGLLFGLLR